MAKLARSAVLTTSASVAILACLLYGQQEVFLKVSTEGFQKTAIDVAPVRSNDSSDYAEELRQIVINDLNLSGLFVVVGSDRSASSDSTDDRPEPSVRLDAAVEIQNRNFTLNAKLNELPSHDTIFTKKYKAELTKKRWTAHELANDIVNYLTGERGMGHTQIAFVRKIGNGKEIGVMDYDGYGEQLLTRNGSLNLSPAWSPSADRLVFTGYMMGNPDLYLLHLASGKTAKISRFNNLYSAPAWSPNGKRIAFTMSVDGNADFYTMDEKGGNLTKLTNSLAIDSSPSWSPNGRELVFTSDRSGSPQLYIMNADGTDVRRLTFEGRYNDSPAWSPRGDLIAFVSRLEGEFQVFTIDVNGESLRQLTFEGSNENPSWAPNGVKLAFASNRNGKWNIYMMNRDGSDLKQVTVNGENTMPKWSAN